jgi:hypothetical protein
MARTNSFGMKKKLVIGVGGGVLLIMLISFFVYKSKKDKEKYNSLI